ncbi:MAG: carboxypeptidase-like regulatory domain-containing protein [Bacteroidota bacterium]
MKQFSGVLFLFLFHFLSAFTQQTISGKIINADNGQAVAGASVFISNSSRGTVSNSSGDFLLSDIPPGKHELVASSISYQTFVQSFSGDELPLQVNIKLKLKVTELEGVTVVPFEKDGWAKWGKVFLDNFIGAVENAAGCKITNYKSIRFRFFKKEDKLTASSTEPLIVINKALGYKIKFQLEDFQVDYKNATMIYLGYPLFEEMKGSKRRWRMAREKAFRGSVTNFIRSLYTGKLQEEGFAVKRLKKIPNWEKQRIKEFYKPVKKTKLNEKTGETITTVDYDYEQFSKDSIAYYARVMRQEDIFDVYGDSLLTADSVITVDTKGTKYLNFPDYLFVNYKPFNQQSSVVLAAPVAIEANGNYYSPQDFFSLGYWSWSEKIANMLPFDYGMTGQ